MRGGLAAAALIVTCALSSSAFAGDMGATMSGKQLLVTGSAGADAITISKGTKTDSYVLTPGAGTTIYGEAAPLTFEGVRSITMFMGLGDDRVDVGAIDLRGHLRVRLDDGNDTVVLTGTVVRGRTVLRGAAGADTMKAEGSSRFHGPVRVLGEQGNDDVQFVGAEFRNRLRVEGGNDDDRLLLQGAICRETSRFEFWGGRGHDNAELVLSQFGHDAIVDLGPDEDRLRIAGSQVTLDVEAFGGSGFDDVLVLDPGNVFLRLTTFDGFEQGEPQ